MPVRGGGFIQGYNCQDAAADDRLMLGGYASPGRRRRAQPGWKPSPSNGARSSPPRTPIPGTPSRRLPRPAVRRRDPADPGHDAAACHAQMTGRIGVLVRRRRLPLRGQPQRRGAGPADRQRQPRELGRPPPRSPRPGRRRSATATENNEHRLATPQGRAAYKRRAPDVEGVHASLEDAGGLRRFCLRGLNLVTSEFLFAGLATTSGCCPACPDPAPDRGTFSTGGAGAGCNIRGPAAPPLPDRNRDGADDQPPRGSLTSRNEPRSEPKIAIRPIVHPINREALIHLDLFRIHRQIWYQMDTSCKCDF